MLQVGGEMLCAAHFGLMVVGRGGVCWVKLEGEAYFMTLVSEIATCRLACAVETIGTHLHVKTSEEAASSSFT